MMFIPQETLRGGMPSENQIRFLHGNQSNAMPQPSIRIVQTDSLYSE